MQILHLHAFKHLKKIYIYLQIFTKLPIFNFYIYQYSYKMYFTNTEMSILKGNRFHNHTEVCTEASLFELSTDFRKHTLYWKPKTFFILALCDLFIPKYSWMGNWNFEISFNSLTAVNFKLREFWKYGHHTVGYTSST